MNQLTLALPESKSPCECQLCKTSRKVAAYRNRVPDELRQEFDAMIDWFWNRDEEYSTELAVLQAKIEGTWPKEDSEEYYTRVSGKLYRLHGTLVEETQEEHIC